MGETALDLMHGPVISIVGNACLPYSWQQGAGWFSHLVSEPYVERLTFSAELLESQSNRGLTGWVQDNIFKPMANTAVVEPHNAVTSSVNDIGSACGSKSPILNDWELYKLPKASLFSSEWVAQNVSSGLAMVVPYGLAALATKGSLRTLGARLELKGTTAAIFKAKETSMILGAGIYDGMRKPKQNEFEHETRIGNSLGGMAGFAVFARGNHLSKDLQGFSLTRARMLTGTCGALTQTSLSHLVSTGKMPTGEQLWNAAVTGATMNVVLPRINESVSDAFTSSQLKKGKSVLVDDFIELEQRRLAAQTGEKPSSPTLNGLVEQSPWTRVGAGPEAAALHGENRVVVPVGLGETLPKLGHELSHTGSPMKFEAAKQALLGGNVEHARALFIQERLMQEQAARQAEVNVGKEMNLAGKESPPDLANLASQQTGRGSTYGQLWAAEFEAFCASNGTELPKVSYSGRREARGQEGSVPKTASDWQRVISDFAALSEAEKLMAAENLRAAPEAQTGRVWSKLIADKNPKVRLAAVEAIDLLPPGKRANAWYEAVASSDSGTRMAAVGKIGSLPAGERMGAWTYALNQPNILPRNTEVRIEPGQSATARGTGTAEALLVEQIETLPSGNREAAWTKAYEHSRTRDAAISNLSVLPENIRGYKWNSLWQEHAAKSRWGQKGELAALAEQVGDLPTAERAFAWKAIVDCPYDLPGKSVQKALLALPEDVRLDSWRQLLQSAARRDAHETKEPYPGDKGVGQALQALPEHQRAGAWHEALAVTKDAKVGTLAQQIQHLPVGERVRAFVSALERVQSPEVTAQVSCLPAESIPLVIGAAAKLPAEQWRTDLLSTLPLGNTKGMDPGRIPVLMQEIFTAASERGLNEPAVVRSWWKAIPEPETPLGHIGREATPVRNHLAETLPVKDLAKMLFNDATISDALASQPGKVRALAKSFDAQPETAVWLEQTAAKVLSSAPHNYAEAAGFAVRSTRDVNPQVAADLFAALVENSSPQAHQTVLSTMRQLATEASANSEQSCLAMEFAARVRSRNPALFDAEVLRPVEAALGETRDYSWRMAVARQLGYLSREGYLGDARINLPSLRLPELELSAAEQAVLRGQVEAALRDPAKLAALMGDGTLGRLFPSVFGHDRVGGMVERPQTGAHTFPTDVHTLKAIENVLAHPEFQKLSPKDQTNLLLATLMHDGGKRRGIVDPGHEWVSSNLTWGVLGTMGYSPQRIQRIAGLVSRHSELSYDPARPAGPTTAQLIDLSVAYRHPSALLQLKILNESDIRALNSSGSYLTGQARRTMAERLEAVGAQHADQLPFPVLTTELPRGFALHQMQGDWALLGHASPFIDTAFLTQRSLIESPSYSVSTSLLAPGQTKLVRPVDVVALVAGAPEAISRAGRQNMSTGTAVDWQGHVNQASAPHPHMRAIASEVVGGSGPAMRARWTALWKKLGQFDTLSELQRSGDTGLIASHAKLLKALTAESDGKPLTGNNEVKLNNATVVGFGLVRRGRTVTFEGMDTATTGQLLGGQKPPAWLAPEGAVGGQSLVVPKTLWMEAQRLRLPIVMVD
ncbi:MAG: hypothetical protein K2W95_12875 [Candidatus Obscuribacterales bacterium]|nr:hypothetical protein [Candidatus Obscuribacterales bacterium]